MSDTSKKGRGKGELSALIDPMLLEGGRRISEVAEQIASQSQGLYTKAQVTNNIRARITFYTKKGYVIERDATERRKIRLVLPTVSPTVAS